MSQIGTLVTFSAASLMKSAEMNQNFIDCRTAHNGARQPFMGSLLGSMPAAVTRYARFGASAFQSAEKLIPMPVGITLSLLTVRLDGSQPGDGSLVVTVRKNSVDTALTLTVTAGAGSGTYQDTTHSVAFAAGDLYSLSIVNNSPGTTSPIRSYSFLGNLVQVASPVSFSALSPIIASDVNSNFTGFKTAHEASRYVVLSSNESASPNFVGPGNAGGRTVANQCEWVVPVAGTLGSLYTYDGSGACTVYVNGVATALIATASSSAVGSNTATTVSVAAGDRIAVVPPLNTEYGFGFLPSSVGALVSFAAGATTHAADANANFAALKAAHNAERIASFVINADNTTTIASATTVFRSPTMTGTPPTTESLAECIIPVATTVRNLYVRISDTAQPAGGSLVSTVRKNGADTALTVTHAAGALANTTQSDTTHSVAFAAGDRICLAQVNNDPANASAGLGSVSATFDL